MNKLKKYIKEPLRYLVLTVGAALYAAAISLLLNPLSLAPGGISGVAIIVNKLTSLPTGSIIFAVNIPLLVVAWIKFGKRMFFSTVYAVVVSSALTDLFAGLTSGHAIITENPLLAGIAGGTLLAIGIGIVFHAGGTTGGSDIIVRLLRRRYAHINTGTIFFILDLIVIVVSAIAFRNIEIALYALITVFISGQVLDFVLYRPDRSKLVYVISDAAEAISERLNTELETGVTHINAIGAYTDQARTMLLCAVKSSLLPRLRRVVEEEDSRAFVIVSEASEVFGEGYKPINRDDL